jgi:hypothetical protein
VHPLGPWRVRYAHHGLPFPRCTCAHPAGLRLGLYSPIKAAVNGDTSFGRKLLAGSLSGGLAAAISSPTELIKVGRGRRAAQWHAACGGHAVQPVCLFEMWHAGRVL